MPGPSIKYENAFTHGQKNDLYLTLKGVRSFLANPHSVVESKKVEIGGVQWYIVAKTFVENATTYLGYYLCGSKDGNWRRWLNAHFCIFRHSCNNINSMSNELRICSAEDAYAEWGFPKFISKEALLTGGYICNGLLHLRLDLSYGIDIFSEESEDRHTNMKLLVQGQSLQVNKELLSIRSPVFERLFKEQDGTEIALEEANLTGLLHLLRVIHSSHEKLNAATVKAVYEMAKAYDVVETCDEHIVGSTELMLAEKLGLADEMKNNKLFDRLVRSLDGPGLKELAVNAEVSVQLRGNAVESYFRQPPQNLFGQHPALKKVLFAQEAKDQELLAYVIGNLTKREIAHLKDKDELSKETFMALVGKALAHSFE
ncbi:Protein BATH-38 [Aphelenchoides avenae]|nr:Protein BATH-38 [Aphelenchus avenae]